MTTGRINQVAVTLRESTSHGESFNGLLRRQVYSSPARLRLKKLAEASLRYFYGDTLNLRTFRWPEPNVFLQSTDFSLLTPCNDVSRCTVAVLTAYLIRIGEIP